MKNQQPHRWTHPLTAKRPGRKTGWWGLGGFFKTQLLGNASIPSRNQTLSIYNSQFKRMAVLHVCLPCTRRPEKNETNKVPKEQATNAETNWTISELGRKEIEVKRIYKMRENIYKLYTWQGLKMSGIFKELNHRPNKLIFRAKDLKRQPPF